MYLMSERSGRCDFVNSIRGVQILHHPELLLVLLRDLGSRVGVCASGHVTVYYVGLQGHNAHACVYAQSYACAHPLIS